MIKIVKLITILIFFVLTIIAIMFTFKICPPKGPWPTPPWCSTKNFERIFYNIKTNSQKLAQIKAINMVDTWGRNYNMNMIETTQSNIESSFDRVKELGASEVYVHDFHRAIYKGEADINSLNYTIEDETFWNDFRDQSISVLELHKLADAAHARGLKIGIKHNMSFVNIGKYILNGLTGNIEEEVLKDMENLKKPKTEEWIRDYFSKWQARMVNKARMYQKAEIDIMSISPSFHTVSFVGREELANDLYKKLIEEVRRVFLGQIYAEVNLYGLLDGNLEKENWNKYDFYKNADIKEVRVYNLPTKFQTKDNPDKAEILSAMKKLVSELNRKAGEKGIILSLFFAPSSYKNSINKGPVEIYDTNNSFVKSLEADMDEQLNSFQSMFESLKNMNNINRINVGNFSWDDALDPQIKPRVSITATFRNKPSEETIKAWFNK